MGSEMCIRDSFQVLQLYMILGGIPYYLKEIKAGKSAVQNIADLCFSKTGLLRREFYNLYSALFNQPERYIGVIRALATTRQGLDRNSLIKIAGLSNGGTISKILTDLEESGFIDVYYPFGKKNKNKIFRLTDEYSLFYLRFIEKHKKEKGDVWQHISQTQNFKIWCGYAFESTCIKHLPQIKKALGISGIYSSSSSFLKKGTATEKGAQIDLVIDRNDKTINVFEIKHYSEDVTISKAYARTLRDKISVFRRTTKTRKHIYLTFIAPFGLTHNINSLGLVDQILTLDDLF